MRPRQSVVDTVVVVAGGLRPGERAFAAVPVGAVVIGADRGAEYALAHGLTVDAAVGDFDSISAEALAALGRAGVRLERHPPDKDAVDLELALALALTFAPRRVLVLGSTGGRLDHLLGALSLLGRDDYAGVELDAIYGRAAVHVVRRERLLAGRVGELISLLALHGPAVGIETAGLSYPFRGETLAPGSSRGISNVFTTAEARIRLESGVLTAVRPSFGR